MQVAFFMSPVIIGVNILATALLYRKFGGRLLVLLLLYWIAALGSGVLLALASTASPIFRVGAFAPCFFMSFTNARMVEILAGFDGRPNREIRLFVLTLAATGLLYDLGASPLWLAVPLALATAYPGIVAGGRVLWRRAPGERVEAIGGAVVSILSAVHMCDFPLLYMNPQAFIYGYSFGFILIVGQMAFLTCGVIERLMRQRIEERERMIRDRDEFLSVASHELKTPITALKTIMQFSERVLRSNEGAPLRREDFSKNLAIASAQTDRLSVLVGELLDVVKIRSGHMTYRHEPVDLSELARDIMRRYSSQLEDANCALDMSIEPGVFGLWDRSRVEQAIVNLVGNAVKYAPGNRVGVLVQARGGFAEISISDNGPGIPAHLHEKIFDRFERADSVTHIGGLGLGLFIVKQIVTAHGGGVDLKSEVGKGTTFNIRLPMPGIAN